jgi:hypothetical protein
MSSYKCLLFLSNFKNNSNCQQILGKVPNMKFQNNPPGKTCVPYGGIARYDGTSTCSLVCEHV